MNQTRSFLLIAWLVVGYFLWDAWQRDYATPAPTPAATDVQRGDGSVATPPAFDAAVPEAPVGAAAPAAAAGAEPVAGAPVAAAAVRVTTDLLDLEFDATGGTLLHADLLAHRVSPDDGAAPVTLLSTEGRAFHIAETGMVSATDAAPSHRAGFTTARDSYALAEGADRLEVPFTWTGPDGVEVRRVYVFERGSYAIGVRYEIRNGGSDAWQGNVYRQLQRVPPVTPARSFFSSPEAFSFTGVAWYSPEDKFNKLAFDDFADEPLQHTVTGGWTAMLQHYFVTAWVPPADAPTAISSAVLDEAAPTRYLVRQVGPPVSVPAGGTGSSEATLYVGPKLHDHLEVVAPGLDLSVDYGFLTIISKPLFWVLKWLHALFGNWGWAIIGLVVLIKAVFFKLSETQFKSFAKMRRVQPRIEALKERYGDDRQKFQQAMMELYKKERINPMGGCLPILVQIPVFIALYWVLVESVELRHAPWILWIDNLTARDPYFVLPALNMLAMFLTQKLSPAPGMDPMQRKMMQAMPFVFGVMFAFFPAGLVLYWATNGWLGLIQQWYIMRRHGEPVKA